MDGMFDKAKDKLKQAAGDHGDKVDQGVDKAADLVDDKTDGKHTDKIHEGAETLKNKINRPT